MSYDDTSGLVVELGSDDVAQIQNGILVVAKRGEPVWFEILSSDSLPQLPENVVPLSPILNMQPDGASFEDAPVLVVLRTCVGTNKAWRSVPPCGWEPISDVEFHPGHAVLRLTHFCSVFCGEDAPNSEPAKPKLLKVLGFLNMETRRAKCAVLHANCQACEEDLADCREDPDLLQSFERCDPSHVAGRESISSTLTISQEHDAETIPLVFLPSITKAFAANGTHFEVNIAQARRTFSGLDETGNSRDPRGCPSTKRVRY